MSRDPMTAVAVELCRKWPDAPARTLARRLVAKTNGALTLEQARMRIMRQFGAHGAKNRRRMSPAAPREPRQAGVTYEMPKSMAPTWTPFTFPVPGLIGILSDVHVPYHSEIAVQAAITHLKNKRISGLLLNGDIADFYAISRFDRDPQLRDFKAELEAVRSFIGWLRQEFSDIPIVYKLGNHEERWQHWLWQHAPEISDEQLMSLTAWLKLGEHDVTLVDDQRVVMLGSLPVLHGHELPKGLASPVNVARGAFMRTLSTLLVGHSHRTSGHAESDMWHDETFCWSTGCLCDLTPAYSRINKWNWGFATCDVDETGSFNVENYRISPDGEIRTS